LWVSFGRRVSSKLLSPLMAVKMRRDFATRGVALKRARERSDAPMSSPI
jgi:hypothetical protein